MQFWNTVLEFFWRDESLVVLLMVLALGALLLHFLRVGPLTGAPRSASVVAKTDVECYRLDKEMFEEVLRERPAIAEEMAQVMAIRKAEQQAVLQAAGAQQTAVQPQDQGGEILSSIRRFLDSSGTVLSG